MNTVSAKSLPSWSWIPGTLASLGPGMTGLLLFVQPRRRPRPPQHRPAGGAGLVEPAAGSVPRRIDETRLLAALGGHGEIAQGGDEQVERGLALGFGRLDQHGAVHNQREIHRHRMIALVDHRLGEVERGDAAALEPAV